MVGTALCWAVERRIHWLAVLAALIGSVFIQLGTNIHNDAADFERGGDGPDRIGPPRVTASGLLSATAVNRGAIVCFAIAALMGVYLVYVAGWPILLLGVLSIAAGWGYTGRPFPIAYTPLRTTIRMKLKTAFWYIRKAARICPIGKGVCRLPSLSGRLCSEFARPI
jgi:1,4-dihydroxy-2-naphthoate polyprenyltransferase